MPTYQTPGGSVEEIDRESKPIEAGATNVAGFLGAAEKGPVNEALLVTSWTQYTQIFGGMHERGWLGHGVYQFFQNGGTKAYINNVMELPNRKKEQGAKNGKKTDNAQAAQAAQAAEKKTSAKIENPPDIADLIMGKDEAGGKKTGLFLFDDVPDITIVAAPGVSDLAAQNAILGHCERNRFRFAVLDAPETLKNGIDTIPMPRKSMMGAYYFPWVEMFDAVQDQNVYVPPSGGICGIYSKVDATRGVHKAPSNEIFKSAVGLKYHVSGAEEELLSVKGINCIREFPGRNIRVCSARTLIPQCSVHVCRLSCMIEQSIQKGICWAENKTNTKDLREKLASEVSAFLRKIWESGALSGGTPEEAFFVRCDDERNPQKSINNAVVVEIGIAPAKPDEFIMLRISQKTLENKG